MPPERPGLLADHIEEILADRNHRAGCQVLAIGPLTLFVRLFAAVVRTAGEFARMSFKRTSAASSRAGSSYDFAEMDSVSTSTAA